MNLSVVSKASNRLKNTFKFKDQLPKYPHSIVIYKITCNTCNSV